MKKLTILMPDSATLAGDVTAALLGVALDFRVEHIPDAPAAPSKRSRAPRKAGMTGPRSIQQHYTPSGEFTLDSAAKWLQAEGYAPQSVSACLSKLVKEGRVARTNDGRFRFVNTAGANLASVPNGAK